MTKITVVCENSVGIPFAVIGEHGFSAYIETEKGNFLFDTGQGFGIVQNSLALKKDLSKLSAIMISHGHYDHTGGLDKVLMLNGKTKIYGHPDIFTKRFWKKDGSEKFIGISQTKEYLEAIGGEFVLNKDMQEIAEGVYLTGEIERTNNFEKLDSNMLVREKDGKIIQPDPILDDLSLILKTAKGLVIVLGCAHSGMINILDYVVKNFKNEKIYAVIGGTHLGFASDEQFEETLKKIDEYEIEKVGVSHCTGLLNASRLHSHLKEKFFFGSVGTVLEI